jgi:hypothetical protein
MNITAYVLIMFMSSGGYIVINDLKSLDACERLGTAIASNEQKRVVSPLRNWLVPEFPSYAYEKTDTK